jgi:threonine dehydrogenase-like Zn-dependent dehydrogenase
MSATCVCGSELWPYRGIGPVRHRFLLRIRQHLSPLPGGYQSSYQHKEFVGGAQAPVLRVPLAHGTLVATRDVPSDDLIPSLLALSDVMGTGWFAADAANVKPGMTVAVVGYGAVGRLGVLSTKQMGAERIIAMSRHESRQRRIDISTRERWRNRENSPGGGGCFGDRARAFRA